MKTASNLYNEQNYLCPSRYISGRIVEYDIRSANISCLRHCEAISQEDYDRLNQLPKMQREIEIGLMEKKNPELYTKLQATIRESRKYLLEANNIEDSNVVRIANDAVYINSPVDLMNTKIGNYIEFRQKSISNIYLNLNKVIFFIRFLQDGNIDIDVKGIKDYQSHQEMVSLISYTVTILERSGIVAACEYLNASIEAYLNLALDINFYKRFSSDSGFIIKGAPYILSAVNEEDKPYLDISYNYNILRELWSILIEIYSMRRK